MLNVKVTITFLRSLIIAVLLFFKDLKKKNTAVFGLEQN